MAAKTISEIIDNYWASKIENECCTRNRMANHFNADNILCEILEMMTLNETSNAYKKVVLDDLSHQNPII